MNLMTVANPNMEVRCSRGEASLWPSDRLDLQERSATDTQLYFTSTLKCNLFQSMMKNTLLEDVYIDTYALSIEMWQAMRIILSVFFGSEIFYCKYCFFFFSDVVR